MGHTLTVLLHAAGGMLLLCAGMGCGFTAAAHIRDCQRQLHSLSRLFGYLAELLNAQALAGPELLHRAARCPEFADFCPAALAPAGGLSGRTDRHFAVVRSGLMDIDLVFKIAATGIIVAVLNQLLIRSGREDQAMMTTLAGLIVVLTMLVRQISDLFVLIKALFEL